MKKVYLDNSATTRVDDEVLQAMLPYFQGEFGNASSIHGYGQRARAAVEEARQQVAGLLGADPKEIVFTSGGTESDNTAVRGIAEYHKARGNHIITSRIEHHAVLNTCKALEKEGFNVTYLPTDESGLIDVEAVRQAITPQTILISIMHANNEIGVIQPLQSLVEVAKQNNVFVHTDAVQSVGKIPVNVKALGVDTLALSGHKIHAPKGIGALYIKKATKMKPLLYGGSHERNRRGGTENVPAIVGLGKACELATKYVDYMNTQVRALRDKLESGILSSIKFSRLNGHKDNRIPNICNFSFSYVEGEALTISLDLKGIAVSTGSACSSGALEPSHVLSALKLPPELIQGAIRFSLSRFTTEAEIDYTLECLPRIVDRLREMSPHYKKPEVFA